jgi:hypothetical protein
MKKLLFIIIGLTALQTFAQKVKYKDVFQMITTGQKEAAFPYLKLLLKSDTSLPSVNLQTGLILYEKAKSFDVLKSNEAALQFCDSAAFYLARAKRLINEKEIRKNDEYYLDYKNLPKPIDNRDSILKRVQNDIERKRKDIIFYKANIKRIFSFFNKSIENYNTAAQLYRAINYRYVTAKEMCLLSDEKLLDELRKIAQTFDSSVTYINAYKKAIKEFPIAGYNQNYTVTPIETYRIDGLTKTDFISANISLWNYSEWAKAMTTQINSDIKKIREQILFYDQRYNKTFDRIQAKTISPDTVLAIKPDMKLYKLLSKYDYNSLAIKILDYKQSKLEFMGNGMSKLNAIENTNRGNVEAKAAFMYGINRQIATSDTALQKLSAVNISKNAPKYTAYISKSFADTVGLRTFIKNEKAFIDQSKKDGFFHYELLMYNQLQKYNDTISYIPFTTYQIPIFQSFEYSRSTVRTTFVKEDKKGNTFITGTLSTGGNFIAKMNSSRQIEWLKVIAQKVPGSTEFPTAIETIDEGCAVVVNSKTGTVIKNTIVKFDKTGLETMSKPMNGNAVARQMIYDEINDGYLIVFKGHNPSDYTDAEEPLYIISFDAAGMPKWTQNFNLYGSVAEFSKIFEGYLFLCNFTQMTTGGSKLESRAGTAFSKSNILMLKLSPSGEVKSYETISSATPVYTIGSVKVSSSNINILGFNGDFIPGYIYQFQDTRLTKLHKVVNSNLEFVY